MEENIVMVTGSITELDCDCIVNAANRTLLGGGGVDGAIHRAAGRGLFEECKKIGGCATGDAKITGGHNLKARYVIHTVGPVYSGSPKDEQMLRSCYKKSLDLARKYDCRSIAFPAISTGVYGYPRDKAAVIAMSEVRSWLEENGGYEIKVMFVCFDRINANIYRSLLSSG